MSSSGTSKTSRAEHFPSTDVLLEEPESPQPGRGKVQLIYVKRKKKNTTSGLETGLVCVAIALYSNMFQPEHIY